VARHSRFKEHRDEASKGHERIGELLGNLFPLCKLYQEYPLDLVLKKGYKNTGVEERLQDTIMLRRARSLRADWVVLDRNLVVEFHGEHHYKEVDYGDGKGAEAHQHRLHLDRVKRAIVRESGFMLIEWPHFEELTEQALVAKIDEVFGDARPRA
jgi:very-short-patch-repair endonuclease